MTSHSDDEMYIPPGQGAGGHEREVPRHYGAPRTPSHRSYYGDPYSDYPYDPRPPRNPYPYAPYRDYHREYPRYPVPPPPQVVYLRDPPDSSRRAKRSEKPGRKIKKDWEIQ